MENERKSGRYEIVAKFDGYCIKCRGKVLAGTGASWRQDSGILEHIVCPPIAPLARAIYQAPPISAGRWKELCKQVQDQMMGGDCAREVISEDVEAEACGAFGGMLLNVMKRTRCRGSEAVEIVRRWKDKQRAAEVDEAKFQEVSQSCRREQPKGYGSPKTDDVELVDWDAEGA